MLRSDHDSAAVATATATMRLEETQGDLRLEVTVDLATGIVQRAGASGPGSRTHRRLAATLVGQTLQDGSEHGVARLEARDRGAGQPSVPGVVQPENCAPVFREAQHMLRSLYRRFCDRSGRGPSVERPRHRGRVTIWEKADDRLRRTWVESALNDVLEATDAEGGVVRIVSDLRVFIAWHTAPEAAVEARAMRDLERRLRRDFDPRVELFLEPRPDKNWVRRKTRTGSF